MRRDTASARGLLQRMEITMPENRWPMDGRAEIAALRRQHQALDDTVRAMESQPSPDADAAPGIPEVRGDLAQAAPARRSGVT